MVIANDPPIAFMLHHNGENWQGMTTGPEGNLIWAHNNSPVLPKLQTKIREISPNSKIRNILLFDDFMNYLAADTRYQTQDIVAFGIGKMVNGQANFDQIYLTGRGIVEYFGLQTLKEDYIFLSKIVQKEQFIAFTPSDCLTIVDRVTQPDIYVKKTALKLGGKDGIERVFVSLISGEYIK